MKQFSFALLAIIILFQKEFVNGFNFDLNRPIFKLVRKDVYFGYSVAQHVVKSSKTPYILVSAPKDSFRANDKFYNMSGSIYKCPISLDVISDCEQIAVDFETIKSDEISKGNYLDDNLKEQFKSKIFENQWFGVSLASTGYGSFSACAHKYVHYYNFTSRDEHAAYGACYRFNNDFSQEYKHVPCLLYSHEVSTFYFNNYAYCQAGVSLSMIEDQTLLPSSSIDTYMSYGMPGALNFRGLVGVRAIGKSGSSSEYLYKNRTSLCKFDIETDQPTYDGYCSQLWEKHSYMGMSHVLIRRYLSKEKLNLIASGAPRENLFGVVRFFTNMFDVSFGQVTKLLNVTLVGPQKGAYFGFSMVACDVNGDKNDDLIVGAPYYSQKYEPNKGAIYIYLNSKTKGFSNSFAIHFTGDTARSLFGHAIASLGDIDKDGYSDFAVGAPFETNPLAQDETTMSMGAIYIYRGNKNAEKIKLSQKIYASDIKLPPISSVPNLEDEKLTLRGFGFSLSGGIDMDSNTYPDLAVGVLNSNAILLLRTMPIIRIKSSINNNQSIQDLDQKIKECKKDANSKEYDTVCFNVDICFEFSNSSELLQVNKVPLLNYTLEADVNQTAFNSRVYFNTTQTNFINRLIEMNGLNSGEKTCEIFTVYIKKDNYDYLRPIKFQLKYKFSNKMMLVGDEGSQYILNSNGALSDIKNHPVVHEDSNSFEFEANFKKDCGIDKKCLTDLKLHAYFVNLLVDQNNIPLLSFKESDSVTIALVLENTNVDSEPAYATQIEIDFDSRLDFKKKTDQEPSGFTCAIDYRKKANKLLCKMTNEISGVPFAANHSVKFNLTFSSIRLLRYGNITSQPNIRFNIEAKTLSTDTDLKNNVVEILAKLKVRTNLFLYGKRTPEQVFYSDNSVIRGESAIKNFEQIGPIIEHTYIINNGGPFSVNSFQLIVDWPYETRLADLYIQKPGSKYKDLYGKHLLYLTEKPTKIPNNHPINVICSSYLVDPLKISENKQVKRSLDEELNAQASEQSNSRIATIDCYSNTAYCYKINCSFYGDFGKDERISLKFTARLWNSTLVEDYANYEKVLIKSNARILMSDDVHDDKPRDNENSVATIAYSNIVVKTKKQLPIWIYILSVLIGLFLLFICVLGFWMFGFFERKKFGDEKYMEESDKVKKTPY